MGGRKCGLISHILLMGESRTPARREDTRLSGRVSSRQSLLEVEVQPQCRIGETQAEFVLHRDVLGPAVVIVVVLHVGVAEQVPDAEFGGKRQAVRDVVLATEGDGAAEIAVQDVLQRPARGCAL